MPQSPQQAADYTAKLDRFAELLSLDLAVSQIAERMGLKRSAAHKMLTKLRAKYGWQAA